MTVAYALPVIEEAISCTYRKAKINSESKMWKNAMEEEISSVTPDLNKSGLLPK